MRVKILVVIFQVIAKLWEKRLVLIMNPLPKGMMIQESDQRRRFDSPEITFYKTLKSSIIFVFNVNYEV